VAVAQPPGLLDRLVHRSPIRDPIHEIYLVERQTEDVQYSGLDLIERKPNPVSNNPVEPNPPSQDPLYQMDHKCPVPFIETRILLKGVLYISFQKTGGIVRAVQCG